jgi:hypothetical protein
MRGALAALAAPIIGCGGHATPARVPDHTSPMSPHAQVVDVASLPPLAKGFHFHATLHVDDDQKTIADEAYDVEILEVADGIPSSFRFRFQEMRIDGQPSILTDKTYAFEASPAGYVLIREDSTGDHVDVSTEEVSAIEAFYQQGGAFLPGRAELVGQKLEKGVAVPSADLVTGLSMMRPVSNPTAATVTLDALGDDGIATIALAASGDTPSGDQHISWGYTGTLRIAADTLLPTALSISFVAHAVDPANPEVVLERAEVVHTYSYPP